jgi:hypothetical protein
MSSSQSSPTNTTQTTTNAKETNLSAANTQGITLVGNKGPVTLESTCEGAVQAGTSLGQLAIASNTGLSESLSSDYANEVNTASTNSANLVDSVLTQGFTFLANENDTIQNIEQQNATNQSDALANYATTLSNISTAQDTSQASQSTAFATSALKIAAVVVLGVALVYFASKG